MVPVMRIEITWIFWHFMSIECASVDCGLDGRSVGHCDSAMHVHDVDSPQDALSVLKEGLFQAYTHISTCSTHLSYSKARRSCLHTNYFPGLADGEGGYLFSSSSAKGTVRAWVLLQRQREGLKTFSFFVCLSWHE